MKNWTVRIFKGDVPPESKWESVLDVAEWIGLIYVVVHLGLDWSENRKVELYIVGMVLLIGVISKVRRSHIRLLDGALRDISKAIREAKSASVDRERLAK